MGSEPFSGGGAGLIPSVAAMMAKMLKMAERLRPILARAVSFSGAGAEEANQTHTPITVAIKAPQGGLLMKAWGSGVTQIAFSTFQIRVTAAGAPRKVAAPCELFSTPAVGAGGSAICLAACARIGGVSGILKSFSIMGRRSWILRLGH